MEPLRPPVRYLEPRHTEGLGVAGWIAVIGLSLFSIVIASKAYRSGWSINFSKAPEAVEQVTIQTTIYECAVDGRVWRQAMPCPIPEPIESSSTLQNGRAASRYEVEADRRFEIEQNNRAAERRVIAEADARYRREVIAAQRSGDYMDRSRTANAVSGECAGLKATKESIQEGMRRYGYGIEEGERLDARLRNIFYRQNELRCS